MAEAISQTEFDHRLGEKELVLTLTGMSGSGKSWTGKKLVEEQEFSRLDCDGMIKAELDPVLEAEGLLEPDTEDTEAIAAWMGQPGDKDFKTQERKYLDLEEINMRKIIGEVSTGNYQKNTVVDTTGSVVHLPPGIREALRASTTVVLFEVTDEMKDEMFDEYLANPKPLVWGNNFDRRIGETVEEARQRCYPELLQHRSGLYLEMAHVVIPFKVKFAFADTNELLGHIKDALPV